MEQSKNPPLAPGQVWKTKFGETVIVITPTTPLFVIVWRTEDSISIEMRKGTLVKYIGTIDQDVKTLRTEDDFVAAWKS
jgi:hypothetical protein